MEECTTWQCINSFASWLSALGVIVISGIALWLSIRDKLIRVRGRFTGALIPSHNPKVLDTYAYSLEFVNIGVRTVTVTNFEWHWKNFIIGRRIRSVITPYLHEEVVHLSSKFPVRMEDGDSGGLFFPKNFLALMDEPGNFLFHSSKPTAFFRIFTSKIYLCTSVKKLVKVRFRMKRKVELWRAYKSYVEEKD